jgi:hypothetical protein
MAQKNLSTWNFKDENVQDLGSVSNIISSESIVVLAGPPKLRMDSINEDLIPIGLVENATVTQNKQMQQLWEIGSRQPYFVPGRTFIQAGLTRVLFDGQSLLKAIYQMTDSENWPNIDAEEDELPGWPYNHDAEEKGQFFINLASQFFNNPLGLGFVIKDQEEETYGGFYLEECYIQNHQFTVQANQTVVLENSGLRATKIVPIELNVTIDNTSSTGGADLG